MHSFLRLQVVLRPAGDRDADSSRLHGLSSLADLAPDRQPLPSPLIRRVLGKALIDLFCPYGEPRCQPRHRKGTPPAKPTDCCALARSCPYGVLFAASASARPPFAIYAVPNAPGRTGRRQRLEVTLYGPSTGLYPWLLSGLERAFRAGLGKFRERWQIDQVLRVRPDREVRPICGRDLSRLPATLEPDTLALTADRYLAPRPIEVRLLSPTRLIRDGKLLPRRTPVPFEILVARSLDRFRGLYGDDASDLLQPTVRRAIEADAARVPLLRDRTRWIEVKDYSARSRSELKLGGRVGQLVYGEEAIRFFPILRAGEILHLGKNPASGCGRIRVDASTSG